MNKPAAIDLDADPAYAFAPESDDGAVEARAQSPATPVPPAPDRATGESRRSGKWLDRLNPFQEQQFARRVTREIVELRQSIEKSRPGVSEIELMRLLVMARCQLDSHGARKLLDETDESFAAWPTTRDMNFADVVHMIAFREFHVEFGKTRWINANMGQIVAAELQRLL